jgi:hypothetical protein
MERLYNFSLTWNSVLPHDVLRSKNAAQGETINMNDQSLVMWGERGLVASLFVDLHAARLSEGWERLLANAGFAGGLWEGKRIDSIHAVVEPDFSNDGFGHPDAIFKIIFESGETIVFIMEAKRLPYTNSCSPSSNRAGAGYNSTLNGQLELNHCLALALSEYREGQATLSEPQWVMHSPYGVERRGRPRALKNGAVIESVAKPFAGLPFLSYHHLIITPDLRNPFSSDINAALWPELFHPQYPFQNCWAQLRSQFGWLSWEAVRGFLVGLEQDGLLTRSLFLPTFQSNRANFRCVLPPDPERSSESAIPPSGEALDLPVKELSSTGAGRGATMIYAPSINPGTFLHFSWLNESCALRDYSKSPTIMPLDERSISATEVRKRITKQVVVRNRRPISDTQYWYQTTLNLNQAELVGDKHRSNIPAIGGYEQ